MIDPFVNLTDDLVICHHTEKNLVFYLVCQSKITNDFYFKNNSGESDFETQSETDSDDDDDDDEEEEDDDDDANDDDDDDDDVYEYQVENPNGKHNDKKSVNNSNQQYQEYEETDIGSNISVTNYDYNDAKSIKKNLKKKNKDHLQIKNYNSPNPLLPFVFFKRLIEVMENYFGKPLNPLKLEANYDILCLLINEMIQDGFPFITDLNQLRDIVQLEGLLSKFISSTTSQISKVTTTAPYNSNVKSFSSKNFESTIPWRRQNVKYTNNELFVDIIESIDILMSAPSKKKNKKTVTNFNGSSAFYNSTLNDYDNFNASKPLMATIQGQIQLTCHLSGIPDLQMVLNLNGHDFDNILPSFHPCISVQNWLQRPGILSFIPPDGKSILMNYEIDLLNNPNQHYSKNIGLINIDYKTGLGLNSNEFEIKVFINKFKTVRSIDNFKINIDCELIKSKISSIKIIRLSQGDFQFSSNGKNEWVFDKSLIPGINPIFRGTIISNDDNQFENNHDASNFSKSNSINKMEKPLFPTFISASYSYKGCIPSGVKVESLKILNARGLGENIKPYKGVKYITTTDNYICR
ncbi:clathrin adaptor, mu subunit [Ascoidea rubescens DSM 1968]|uniref:Clathrin adaptor, mu subunit n=1 Tax=Ascoidea rubescens DSM 1968 TaxID=1344418 RepID=A0A1D2VRH7_9ASCO|nr:clathrin adaptor, mu subunit [Ascoidea rubescens DSM 1968]ODV64200.1 clathrin adaptor, mu subunit [Ascoidea rubescens DSM 1968]